MIYSSYSPYSSYSHYSTYIPYSPYIPYRKLPSKVSSKVRACTSASSSGRSLA